MNDASRSDAESKLAAPKLFGRKKPARAPEPAAEPVGEPVGDPAEPAAESPAAEEPAAEPTAPVEATLVDETPAVPVEQPTAPKPPRERRPLPKLSGLQVAAAAGVLVGVFLVLATYGSLHLCASVRGASTCGGKAGFPLLLAIGIVAVVGGGTLLRLFGVRSPMGDSFLAVALVAVVTVLFLGNHYGAWWMLIVVPVLSLVAYLLAHWVSVKYIDPTGE